MTAKRCPVRDILRSSSGSVSADLENEASWLGNRIEGYCSESFSTGLMPGVIGVIRVGGIDGWRSSFALSYEAALGESTSDTLPSVVSRDSASSSNSKTRSLAALLLLAAYIRGAPMGQYMAARCRMPHSYGRMPAKWHISRASKGFGIQSMVDRGVNCYFEGRILRLELFCRSEASNERREESQANSPYFVWYSSVWMYSLLIFLPSLICLIENHLPYQSEIFMSDISEL